MNAMQIRSLLADGRTWIGVGLTLLGAVVTAGWLLHLPALVQIVPGSKNVVLQTAWCFGAAGAALLATALQTDVGRVHRVAGGFLVLVAVLVLAETLTGVRVGIDLVSLHEWIGDGNPTPGRMAPNTAIAFLFAGLAILIADESSGRARTVARALAAVVVALGILGLAAHFMRLEGLYAQLYREQFLAPETEQPAVATA